METTQNTQLQRTQTKMDQDYPNVVKASPRVFDRHNTIDADARIHDSIRKDNVQLNQWYPLHIDQGIASFAQEHVFFDEQVRFTNKVSVYNELIVLRVFRGSLSIDRLQRAVQYLFNKHKALRTSLIFNQDDNILKQYITCKHPVFRLTAEQILKDKDDLNDIIHQIAIDPNLFDLSIGHVFHCRILRQQKNSDQHYNNGIIATDDIFIIAFHQVTFDLETSKIFLNDLCDAYNNDETWSKREESLEYIDYSAHERVMDMTVSREFWSLELKGYNLEHRVLLPVDRHHLSTDHRSESAWVIEIAFDDDISTAFINYAASHQVTLFQLGLAAFYTFLFKLTHDQRDICITSFNVNRYRTELQNIIGIFVATLPYRNQLDPQWPFDELVKHVRKTCLAIFEHSHYPMKCILANSQQNPSNVSFLQTIFDFITVSSNIDRLSFDGTSLEQMSLPESSEVAKVDFMLRFMYDSRLNDGRLSCRFICSRDLFDETTIATISRGFQHLLEQLISSKSDVTDTDELILPISKLSLILPEEKKEIQGMVFHRLSSVDNEGMYVSLLFLLNQCPGKPRLFCYIIYYDQKLPDDRKLNCTCQFNT